MLTRKKIYTVSNASQANAIAAALSPETRSTHEKRARTTITVKNSRLTITNKGSDSVYVKASQDTYGKLVSFLQSLKI